MIRRGGWRNLNYGEDVEMVSRVGFDIAVPVITGCNERLPAHLPTRERRYRGLGRIVKASIDLL
ncbi:MAG: hypothetical protein QXJ69_00420 [Desulfurococcaceae archaeon]